jgi:regulator of protease activity HflC (stomatin/prohibitin superfamily)
VDEVGLYYSGGPIEGRKFQRVINPGSGSTILGIADDVFWLPAGQRNYIVSKDVNESDKKKADFIRVPTKGGILMDFEISVYFRLNTATDDLKDDPRFKKGGTLRKFWENIGKKYGADTEDGWDKMLNDNFRKIIETSMRQKAFNFTVDELYANAEGQASGNEDAIQKIQNEIASALKDNVNSSLGGNYFCGPTFNRDKPGDCPPFQFIINSAEPADGNVISSFSAQRVAANEVITAQNRAKAREEEAKGTAAVKKAEAQGIVDAQNALKDNLSSQFLRLQEIEAMKACATSGKTICIFGGGSGVNLNLPAG